MKFKHIIVIIIISSCITFFSCASGNCYTACPTIPAWGPSSTVEDTPLLVKDPAVVADVDAVGEEEFSVSAFMQAYIEAGSRL